MGLPRSDQPFVSGSLSTDVGAVPCIRSSLTWKDFGGTFKVRCDIGRMHYTVDPGLYALGRPDRGSPVLVTANYKLSFDHLRKSLPGRSAWVLVLDTKGINVWCAAGKGTFGTSELVHRIKDAQLERIVDHRNIVVPQLGAPGIAAYEAKRLSGFRVHYGPAQAKDLPEFLDAGMRATPEMRLKIFSIGERAVLIPVELIGALKPALFIVPVLLILGGLSRGPNGFWLDMLHHGLFAALSFLTGIVAGTVLTPLLLPWIPGRAFSLKGAIVGFLTALIYLGSFRFLSIQPLERPEMMAGLLLITTGSAYLGMNFTGASTYTSLSGVRKEMRWALPLEVGGATLALVLWIISLVNV